MIIALSGPEVEYKKVTDSALQDMMKKSFDDMKDDLKQLIQDQFKQSVHHVKKPPAKQDLIETKIEQLKKELKQIQLQQFHEIRNQQKQLILQQNKESQVKIYLSI